MASYIAFSTISNIRTWLQIDSFCHWLLNLYCEVFISIDFVFSNINFSDLIFQITLEIY